MSSDDTQIALDTTNRVQIGDRENGNIDTETKNVKGQLQECNKITEKESKMYKIDVDLVMKKLEVPNKKLKENVYLIAVNTREQVENVVEQIQEITEVSWTVTHTKHFDKSSQRTLTLFKRYYGCHMSTRRRSKTKNLKHKRSRNIGCKARLIVTIRRSSLYRKSKYHGLLLDDKYPCLFEFSEDHNHKLDAVDVLNIRPLTEEIKQDILKLLNKGHSCSSAYFTYYTIKSEEFGADYKTKIDDRRYFPRRSDVTALRNVHNIEEKMKIKKSYSTFTVRNVEEILNSYKERNGTLYKITAKKSNFTICLCTPLMQRSIKQVSKTLETLFIHSTTNDIKGYRMYFILAQSSIGALPISCIITNSSEMNAFNEGLKLFFEMVHVQPSIILTSEEIMEELIERNHFPSSQVLISFYYTLNSCWKHLYDIRQEIVKGTKESYYKLFRDVVFSDTEETLEVSKQVLAVECSKQKFLDYVDKMYKTIPSWCLFYRIRNFESFDYDEAEISFRLFRLLADVPLKRTKHFDATQILDFMCSAFEKFYKSRMIEMILCKRSIILSDEYLQKPIDKLKIQDIGYHQYLFKPILGDSPEAFYQVDMLNNVCTCATGIKNKYCEHIAEVISQYNIFAPLFTIDQKVALYFTATGILRPKNTFLPEYQDYLDEEQNIIDRNPEAIIGPTDDSSIPNETPSEVIPSLFPTFNETKNKWITYCYQILQYMEKDPVRFMPAVNFHLDNVQKNCTTIELLLKGLYSGFPYKGNADNLPPLIIIDKLNKQDNGKFHSDGQNAMEQELNKHQLLDDSSRSGVALATEQKDSEPIESQMDHHHSDSRLWDNNQEMSEDKISTNRIQLQVIDNLKDKTIDEQLVIHPGKIRKMDTHTNDIRDQITPSETNMNDNTSIYVDQSTLPQLTQSEMAVLENRKDIMIIPISQSMYLKNM